MNPARCERYPFFALFLRLRKGKELRPPVLRGKLLKGRGIFDLEAANGGPAQCRQIGSGAERGPEVMRQGPDVGPGRAADAEDERRRLEREQCKLMDHEVDRMADEFLDHASPIVELFNPA